MFDHKAVPQTERYITPGSPEATMAERANTLRNAIYRKRSAVAAADPSVLKETAATQPMAAVEESNMDGHVSVAGGAAVGASVSETPAQAEAPALFEDDPVHEMSQEMFIEAARKEVDRAQQNDQELQNA